MLALPYEEVADCIAKVKASRRASASSKLALEFLVLTAARSVEVRKATWDEIDAEGDVDGAGRADEGEPVNIAYRCRAAPSKCWRRPQSCRTVRSWCFRACVRANH